MRRLPPLAAVRVFEAAARHGNFTAAAAELGMTQAAVSYQVRLLEERVAAPLFRRERRRVVLTDPGRRLAARLTGAFDTMDAAFAELRQEDEAVLTVSTSQTFANAWFAWRLGAFQAAQPGLAVRLVTDNALVDFAARAVDCAVRTGRGPWPGLAQHLLVQRTFTPMCSAAFWDGLGGAVTPADLPDQLLIGSDDDWWRVWFAAAGVPFPERPARPGVQLDSQAHEGHAAIAGQGFALLTPFFWRADLASGRLVRPFALEATTGSAYWLVYPEHRRHVPKIRRFRDWLLAEVAKDRGVAAQGRWRR